MSCPPWAPNPIPVSKTRRGTLVNLRATEINTLALTEDPLLSTKVFTSSTDSSMADPPTSIKVYIIPTGFEKKPYPKHFSTIKTPILGPTYPQGLPPSSRLRLEFLETKAAEDHLIYDLPEGIRHGPHDGVYQGRSQPDIHLLPDVGHLWSTKDWQGWEKRAAIALKGYHVFYLRDHDAPLNPNEKLQYHVQGKAVLLKVSKARDKTGRRFYVDVDCGAKEVDNLVESFGDQQYFGPQKWEKDILAAKMSLEGPESHLQYIHTVTENIWRISLFAKDEFHIYVPYLRDEDAEPPLELGQLLSKVEQVALPDTRPCYPEHLSAEDLEKVYAVIGNSRFHAFLERVEESNEDEPPPREFTLLKVSGDVDRHGRWFYEDVDSDPGELMMELGHNMKQLISYFKFR